MGLALANGMNAKLISLLTAYDAFCFFHFSWSRNDLQLRINWVMQNWLGTRGGEIQIDTPKKEKTKSVKNNPFLLYSV